MVWPEKKRTSPIKSGVTSTTVTNMLAFDLRDSDVISNFVLIFTKQRNTEFSAGSHFFMYVKDFNFLYFPL